MSHFVIFLEIMSQSPYNLARTMYLLQKDVGPPSSVQVLARLYKVTPQTIRRWQNFDNTESPKNFSCRLDRSKEKTVLSEVQEAIIVELRMTLLLPAEDLLAIVRAFINPAISSNRLGRCLRYHGVSKMTKMKMTDGSPPLTQNNYRDYEPGLIHVDIKRLPKMHDENDPRYLFVAVDRATRWAFVEIYSTISNANCLNFVDEIKTAFPVKIRMIITTHDSPFSDPYFNRDESSSITMGLLNSYPLQEFCAKMVAAHEALTRHENDKPIVAFLNEYIDSNVERTEFNSATGLESMLRGYLRIYNDSIIQPSLDNQTPVQALKKWCINKPGLF
jgi:hypothetical protein